MNKKFKKILKASAVVSSLTVATNALAVETTNFTTLITTLEGWMSGELGYLIALIAIIVSGVSLVFGNMKGAALAIIVALFFTVLPPIIKTFFETTATVL